MRVLIVTQYFWPESFRINDLAKGLTEMGHQVTVLTGKPNYPGGRFFQGYKFLGGHQEKYGNVDVIRVPLFARGSGGKFRLVLNYISFAFFASVLGPLRYRGKVDAIFVYEPSPVTVGLPALVMKAFKKAPIVFWVQDLWPETLYATGMVSTVWLLSLVESLVRFIYRGSDLILVQSRGFIEAIERLGVSPSKIRYFPNSAEDLYKIEHNQFPQEAVLNLPQGFRVMFAGSVGVAQDFETILEAAEKLRLYKDIQWIILGDGHMLPWVQDQIRRREIIGTMHLLGRHPVESMPVYFNQADVMLVTLRKDPVFAMTIPAKLQSYLACAKPVVAALDGEGARVIEESGAGITVPSGDGTALSESVLTMYHMDMQQRQTMGQRGRAYFDTHFSRDVLLEHLDKWLKTLQTESNDI